MLVDAGMVVDNKDEKKNFIGLLAAIGRGNGREAADFVLKFSKVAGIPRIRLKIFEQRRLSCLKGIVKVTAQVQI